jgi:hypothetical protein
MKNLEPNLLKNPDAKRHKTQKDLWISLDEIYLFCCTL